jgi:hypothetical protein
MSLLWGLKSAKVPESDFKNLGALRPAAARLSAAVSLAGFAAYIAMIAYSLTRRRKVRGGE